MNYAIVYASQTGNTKLIAQTIRDALPAEKVIYFGEDGQRALSADRIYVGFWTDKGSCDSKTAEFLKTLTNQQVFLFGTAGFGGQPSYFEKILEKTKEYLSADCHVVGTYLCQGKMPMSVRERYVNMQKNQAPVPNLQGMIDNFDKALSHPDQQDLDGARKAVLDSI